MDKENNTNLVKPIIKWAGGKEKELKIIKKFLPTKFEKFVEPFVGGGSVFLNFGNSQIYINDKSEELILIYKLIKEKKSKFFKYLNIINSAWIEIERFTEENSITLKSLYNGKLSYNDFIGKYQNNFLKIIQNDCFKNKTEFLLEIDRNIKSKILRTHKIAEIKGNISESEILLNMETSLKSSFYMYLRRIYNEEQLIQKSSKEFFGAVFYFIREYCYSSMFRYSKTGKFNVPYGGISYNRKIFSKKIEYLFSDLIIQKMSSTEVFNMDFEDFLNQIHPAQSDFIFLDPPYDTDFSTYSNNVFDKADQIRLANFLKKTAAKFMLIIKNTPFIFTLYKDFNISSFEKKYLVSFKNRNNKNAEHLIITNYIIGE